MNKRFSRYLLDGGFWFEDEYIEPVWAISDSKNHNNSITYLEFEDKHKDLCDDIVDLLNNFDKNGVR